MYDELVKRLIEPCQYENCVLCQQAADAIERLHAEWKAEAESVALMLKEEAQCTLE